MSIKINAALVTEKRKVEITEITTPDLGCGEVLVKVKSIALCTLEQRVFSGVMPLPLPFLGGHEVSGIVEELGEGVNAKMWSKGDRVAVRLLYNCGECDFCRSGQTNMCVFAQRKPTREGMIKGPGGLCDYVIVKSSDLYKIPDTLSFDDACLTEPLACCVHSVERGNIQFGDNVVVIGAGIMGQFHIMLAKMKGARVIVSEIDESRVKLALKLGADIGINSKKEDLIARVKEITNGKGAEVVFNTTSIGEIVSSAIASVSKGGTIVQYSSVHPDEPTEISPQSFHKSENILTGSISPLPRDFYRANRLLSSGLICVRPLIEKTFKFEDVQDAFEVACIPGTFRVIVNA